MASRYEQREVHHELVNVGLRAQATAAGFVQLCKELKASGALDEAALGRIKDSIADEVALTCPRSVTRTEFRQDICRRLDALFTGKEKIGDADALAFASGSND